MSLPDELIIDYFELITDVPDEEITEYRQQLASDSINPMELKMQILTILQLPSPDGASIYPPT